MRYALLSCLLILAGCATNLQQLRGTSPAGTEFQSDLAALYEDYAAAEQKQDHWFNSSHFADKGLKAAKGEDVTPENPKKWSISKATLPDLQIAHDKLIAALSAEAKASQPKVAADAQFNFDCWVDQQANDPTGKMLTVCRDAFFSALDQLGGNAPMAQVLTPVDKPSDMVFFEWDRANLTEEGDVTLQKMIASLLKDKKDYKITLGGHTDTSGSAKYNLKLSQARADVVKDKMVTGGLDTDKITVFAYGESDPLIRTGDNVREPRNRRVEIFVNNND